MNTASNRSIWRRLGAPLTAAMLLGSAGIAAGATDSTAPELKSTTETVSVQNITVKDGDNLVEVRVIDGEVFIKVNGERRPTRKLSGDWEKLPITVEGRDAPIATVLRDGKSNDRILVMFGSPDKQDIDEFKRNFERRELEAVRLAEAVVRRDLDGEGIRAFRVLEELGDEFFFPAMQELQFELGGEIGPEAMREIERLLGEAAREFPGRAEIRMEGQPRSMIGITMSIASVPEGEVVVIEDVMEGMPASKAGLRSGDRIVEILEIGPGTERNIRKVTRQFEPGQTVALRVLREGEEIEKTLELAPYKANVFGRLGQVGEAPGIQSFFAFERDASKLAELNAMTQTLEKRIAEKQRAIEELARQMATSDNAEEIAAKIQEVARDLEESVRKLSEQQIRQRVQEDMVDRLRAQGGGGVVVGRAGGGSGGLGGERTRVFTIPGIPTPPSPPGLRGGVGAGDRTPSAETERRIDSLEDRLERLEDSNRRIEEMLQILMSQAAERG